MVALPYEVKDEEEEYRVHSLLCEAEKRRERSALDRISALKTSEETFMNLISYWIHLEK